jgi:hypothetical protein
MHYLPGSASRNAKHSMNYYCQFRVAPWQFGLSNRGR